MNWQYKLTSIFGVLFLAGGTALAAPNFPFPQTKQYPYGNVYNDNFTTTADSIRTHFNTWKGAWYLETTQNGTAVARVISPSYEPEYTVSEAIAYGMLIMTYMSETNNDHQAEFNKLWSYWKCFGKGLNGSGCSSWNGQGMDWKTNSNNTPATVEGSGTATDADFDAALALIMADKQWGSSGTVNYLSDAQKLITWIKANDMDNYNIKPGSNWNDAFNPSYTASAAFHLFQEVDASNASYWASVNTTNISTISQCQNSTTGLMPDWCSWSTHQAVETSASVTSGYLGCYADAARTPWRMTWSYYWFGDEAAKAINDKLAPWLFYESYGHATYILPGYDMDGSTDNEVYVSSSFVGGLGLALGSYATPSRYMETVYETLANTRGKASYDEGGSLENYYEATLNIIYMLLVTGNMPNLRTTNTTMTPSTRSMPVMPAGTTDPSYTFGGFSTWGTFSDDFGITSVFPDSTITPIFNDNGTLAMKAELRIGPEPDYIADADLHYPFAGIVLAFDSNDTYYDLSDLATIRVTLKTQGVMRLAILPDSVMMFDYDIEGGEPGYWIHPTDDFQTIDISTGVYDAATASFDTKDMGDLIQPAWAKSKYPLDRYEYIAKLKGIKFEPKMSKGGYGSINLQSIEFLNGLGEPVAMYAAAGTSTIKSAPIIKSTTANVSRIGEEIYFNGFNSNAKLSVYALNGRTLNTQFLNTGNGNVSLDALQLPIGVSMIRVNDGVHSSILKIVR